MSRPMNPIAKTILTMLVAVSLAVGMTISPSFGVTKTASAAGAAFLVPVVVETVGELLVAMGIATGTVAGGYALTEAYPYVYDFFYQHGENLADWYGLLPENAYYTDGYGNFYLGDSTDYPVTSVSQLVVRGNSVLTSYTYPTNVQSATIGLRFEAAYYAGSNLNDIWKSYPESSWHLVPYFIQSDGTMTIGDRSLNIPRGAGTATARGIYDTYIYSTTFSDSRPYDMDLLLTNVAPAKSLYVLTSYRDTGLGYWNGTQTVSYSSSLAPSKYVLPSGAEYKGGFDYAVTRTFDRVGYLICDGIPSRTLDVDKDKMGEDTILSVGGSPEPPSDDDDPQEPTVTPPSRWEVFTTVAEFLDDTASNNDTTLQDFIRNDYTLNVNVNINTPDTIFLDTHVSGSLQIDQNTTLGGGINIDVNLNDSTSIPSVTDGDGSGFYNANAVDVAAALVQNNPVISLIKGLIEAIDPTLLAVVSISLSLAIVLGLWKLIRG